MFESVIEEQERTASIPAVNALYSEQELSKDSQVSVRIENGLYQALEAQTKVWGFKNVSQTVRAILTFYFLPVMYEHTWKSKKISDFKGFIQEKQKEGFSLEQAKSNYFVFQLVEYLEFLEQAKVMGNHSMKYMEQVSKKLNSILKEMQGKIEEAMAEIERDKD